MHIHTQHKTTTQKKEASSASSVLDLSSQSESLQHKADMANNAAQREEATRPNNTGMPDNLKSGIESLSGFSMDDVRVHYNSSKPATVQALAYTQGTDIHVAPGQEKCLPHEAWHVAQQMAGRVSPTTNINGMPVNDNAGLEHEADVMGEKASVQMKNHNHTQISTTALTLSNLVQCKKFLYDADYVASIDLPATGHESTIDLKDSDDNDVGAPYMSHASNGHSSEYTTRFYGLEQNIMYAVGDHKDGFYEILGINTNEPTNPFLRSPHATKVFKVHFPKETLGPQGKKKKKLK
nr:DUF4157 domain-containing protein [uncultured Fibrobacter sp.]